MAKKISNITQMDSDIVSMKKMIGDTDISSIGDGTLSGAINSIRNSSGNATESEDVKNLKTIVGYTDISKIADGTLTGAVNEAIDMVKNANIVKVFDTFAEMEAWLKDKTNAGTISVGTDLYIKESDISDYWVSGVLDAVDANTGYYYEIKKLGAEKLDMSKYDDALDNLDSSIADINSTITNIKNDVDINKESTSIATVTSDLGAWHMSTTLDKDLNCSEVIFYANGKFIIGAGGRNSTTKKYGPFLYSTDGKVWDLGVGTPTDEVRNITYGNGMYVAVGNDGIWYSADGITWEDTSAANRSVDSVAYGNGMFVALGSDTSYISKDGVTWTKNEGVFDNCEGDGVIPTIHMAYGNGMFVAISHYDTNILYSSNGINWTGILLKDGDTSLTVHGIVYANNKFIVIYNTPSILGSNIAYSSNGINWTTLSLPLNNSSASLYGVTYGGGKFVAVGSYGTCYESQDGINWTSCITDDLTYNYSAEYVAYGNGKFVSISRTSSTSGIKTACAEFIKTYTPLKDIVEDLKKSVSDGKTLLAEAITGKGVETASDATFETMASNVNGISDLSTYYCDGNNFQIMTLSKEYEIEIVAQYNTPDQIMVIHVYDPKGGQIHCSNTNNTAGGIITHLTTFRNGNHTCFVYRGSGLVSNGGKRVYFTLSGMTNEVICHTCHQACSSMDCTTVKESLYVSKTSYQSEEYFAICFGTIYNSSYVEGALNNITDYPIIDTNYRPYIVGSFGVGRNALNKYHPWMYIVKVHPYCKLSIISSTSNVTTGGIIVLR